MEYGRIMWTTSRSFGDGEKKEKEKIASDNFPDKFLSENLGVMSET